MYIPFYLSAIAIVPLDFVQDHLLPCPETLTLMCQVHSSMQMQDTGLAYAQAQWSVMLLARVAQGLGGNTMLCVITGTIHVCLQQGSHNSLLTSRDNPLHKPFAALAKLLPSLDLPGDFEPDAADELLAHKVFYTAIVDGNDAAAKLRISEVRRGVANQPGCAAMASATVPKHHNRCLTDCQKRCCKTVGGSVTHFSTACYQFYL